MANNNEILIEVKNLKKYFEVGKNATLKAVDDVSFFIRKGETLGLVGESGCGKTTCGRTVMGMYSATGGEVLFNGIDVHKLDKKAKKDFARRAQIIFQDPYASLNPRMTVGDFGIFHQWFHVLLSVLHTLPVFYLQHLQQHLNHELQV